MKKLSGKTALVTGAESGIGQAIAIEFAKEGANVVIVYFKDQENAEETLQQVEQTGQKGLVLYADVSDEQSVAQLFEQAYQQYQTLDILVNDAGVNGSGTTVADMDTATFDRTIKTNLYGPFFCCRAFLKHRLQQGGKGKIVNISSIHEEVVSAGTADYCASKGGLRNLMRTLALEVAEQGINVNNIAPGMILTPMNQKAIDDPKDREQKEQKIPMKRAGEPQEIAKVAVFLASADADYVTGSTYAMDGGLMRMVAQGA
ncbi:glucose 1-dehydrogenase [uncultured Mucilaginibacter sp.]|uniref:SDR family NAD(P)-dependent oxidoreductase n=1 Tax=uncultured Mucilaginibacter sp. TaxID=797541 RepID=UPI00263823F3|nr:glucose 1-dehydrogenase [uncultured Mucilaginibacter sp.]